MRFKRPSNRGAWPCPFLSRANDCFSACHWPLRCRGLDRLLPSSASEMFSYVKTPVSGFNISQPKVILTQITNLCNSCQRKLDNLFIFCTIKSAGRSRYPRETGRRLLLQLTRSGRALPALAPTRSAAVTYSNCFVYSWTVEFLDL